MIHGGMQVFNLFFELFVFLCFLIYEKAQGEKGGISVLNGSSEFASMLLPGSV